MIDPKELRIGNLVYWSGEIVDFDIRYRPGRKEVVELSGFILGKLLQYRPGKDFERVNIDPIPLTEEWLLKFGFVFKRTDKSNTYTLGSFRASFVTEGRFKNKRYLTYGNALTFEDFWNCKYVHQLQNLHYILCGSELEITVIQNTAE